MESKLRDKFQLPGGIKQFEHLLEQSISKSSNALIIGPGSESVVIRLQDYFTEINIIADKSDSLMQTRMQLQENTSVKIKMMDFSHTDFDDNYFDLIYSQGSISVPDRKNILKEIKRILSDNGLFCAGEIVSLKEPVPAFVNDIWEQSGLEPLYDSSLRIFYVNKGFECLSEKDLSNTLKDFYEKIRDSVAKATKDEKEQNKKYFSRMKHESNVYLKLGGDKYIGYKSLILRKPK